MIKLTPDNYYDKNTHALSNSKIKSYSNCPNYFKRKYIDGTVEEASSDVFVFGAICDKLLSGEDFDRSYRVVERRTKALKESAELSGETLLTQSQYDEIFEVASAVENTSAYQTIKRYAKSQVILQVPLAINKDFDSICGKPDWFWVDKDGTCFIVDLKTSKTTSERQYYYTALNYGYHCQLGMYRYLLRECYPEIKAFRCFNLVAEKTQDIYKVELYEYPESMIDEAETWLFDQIKKICLETDYKKYDPKFEEPVTLGSFNNEQYVDESETTSTEDSRDSTE